MCDYSNGKIYRMVNNIDNEEYIGSTTSTLVKRKYQHKVFSTRTPNTLVYKHFNKIGWENVEIILIESCPCENRDELLRRERFWFDELKPSLNKNRPYVSDEEKKEYITGNKEKLAKKAIIYYQNNKEKIAGYYQNNKEKIAGYYQNNKEKIAEHYQDNKKELAKKAVVYYQNNKEKIAGYYQNNKEKIAEHYQNNKENIAEHYQKNKVKIAERYQNNKEDKVNCPCGSCINQNGYLIHLKSKKHLKYIILNNEERL